MPVLSQPLPPGGLFYFMSLFQAKSVGFRFEGCNKGGSRGGGGGHRGHVPPPLASLTV